MSDKNTHRTANILPTRRLSTGKPQSSSSRFWKDVLDDSQSQSCSVLQLQTRTGQTGATPVSTNSSKNIMDNTNAHRRFRCELCDKRFERRGHRQVHIETVHEGRRTHKCPRGCGKSFAHSSSLRRHVKSAHESPPDASGPISQHD